MTLTARLIPSTFSLLPSQAPGRTVGFLFPPKLATDLDVVGFAVGVGGEGAAAIGVDFPSLVHAGFEGKLGQTMVLPQREGTVSIAVGVGHATEQTPSALRDVAAAFARVAQGHARIGLNLGDSFALDPAIVGQLVAEGILLARYRYTELQTKNADTPLVSVDIATLEVNVDRVAAGVRVGEATARATNIARDLSNAPPGHLTATAMGRAALSLGEDFGLQVELFDKKQLIELGCGGLLGVNAGSFEEPCMVKITYSPARPAHRIAVVGKGITYDAGGISLKPSDSMHLLMKMDMAGAAAVLGAMTALGSLGCNSEVTGYLMCTDNMPSGTAMGLGDVLTIRGGTTVEIKNTDAEGRLVMADALELASEQQPDAIIDIATLTGSALQTLGTSVAALFGNNQDLLDQAIAASRETDESIWQLPLEHRYRSQLDSRFADISNMGGPYNIAITAALFLNEFVHDIPWAHLDIAGTMQTDTDDSWRPTGATGFGTRLLIEMLTNFTPVK